MLALPHCLLAREQGSQNRFPADYNSLTADTDFYCGYPCYALTKYLRPTRIPGFPWKISAKMSSTETVFDHASCSWGPRNYESDGNYPFGVPS